ncbi:MAG: hypothetical protein BSOLF_0462 [Candidatus Carbobacillus altaicus]|uniref:Uncharacterized protein n=1 Tax=Candidatus Carbonibacillus altaicus TaxID=2163959 RepID=A0A2R6Y5K1_9BACL|nr:MAG: hypothetical protein BSOLF_0462 [Candidatus Carbobacillus altaicus]
MALLELYNNEPADIYDNIFPQTKKDGEERQLMLPLFLHHLHEVRYFRLQAAYQKLQTYYFPSIQARE